MNDAVEHGRRVWPWNNDDEDNFLEPYDELEDLKKSKEDWNDW